MLVAVNENNRAPSPFSQLCPAVPQPGYPRDCKETRSTSTPPFKKKTKNELNARAFSRFGRGQWLTCVSEKSRVCSKQAVCLRFLSVGMTGGTCGSDQAVETVETYEILEDQEEADSSNPLFTWTPLDEAVIDLLKKLKKQADKIYKVNVTRHEQSAHSFVDFMNRFKHVMADNVKCIIVARNFEAELFEVYASSKRCLSRAVKRFPYTNVIALFRFQAFEELYREIISMSEKSDSHIPLSYRPSIVIWRDFLLPTHGY
ncbi:hypothetical protein KIN20_023939 [Parelaphostrongylus tenuis]|uniref:Uncharacterized protein n=1 Tax=Parelaphostrongylus tenuis TaxID=148309 RepID=A0AAD5N721_PARTN|nr:hypothetical protein KIN20_023939 [Parelaphostrongylus tenuis]